MQLPQQSTTVQYRADGITSVYTYPFLIVPNQGSLTASIVVYVTAYGAQANPATDLQEQGVAYTVQGVNTVTGGTITFQPGFLPINGAIVTISRLLANSVDTNFQNASNFNGANLDNALLYLMMCVQQNTTNFLDFGLRYAVDAYLPTSNANVLPTITNIDNQVWMSKGGSIIPVTLQEGTDTSTLRSELISSISGGDGALLVGYNNGTATTVHAELVSLDGDVSGINTSVSTLTTNVASLTTQTATLNTLTGTLSHFYGASVYLTVNQTVAAAAMAQIMFNAEYYNAGGLMVTGNTAQFTVNKAGYYLLTGQALAGITTQSASSSSLLLYKNGAQYKTLDRSTQNAAYVNVSGSFIDMCVVGDVFTLYYENDSSATNTLLGSFFTNSFQIQFLGL